MSARCCCCAKKALGMSTNPPPPPIRLAAAGNASAVCVVTLFRLRLLVPLTEILNASHLAASVGFYTISSFDWGFFFSLFFSSLIYNDPDKRDPPRAAKPSGAGSSPLQS